MTKEEKKKACGAAYYAANKDKVNARQAVYREANKEKEKARLAAYYEANKDKSKAYYATNKDKFKARNAAYLAANKDKVKARKAAYSAANKDKLNAYCMNRIKTDPIFAIKRRIRCLIGTSLTRKGYTKKSRTHEILGCDYEAFTSHIESQFKDGMSWNNRDGWHIDHIIPLASAQTESEILRLNHFSNLQPLWAEENLKKRDSLPTQGIRNRVDYRYAKSHGMKLQQQSIF